MVELLKRLHAILMRPWVAGVWLTLAVVAATLLVRSLGGLEFAELAVYDRFLAWRGQNAPSDSRVVLVAIEEADLDYLGANWPMSDGTVAELLRTIAAADPRVIGLDIYRDLPKPPGGEALKAALEEVLQVVTITKIGSATEPAIPPPYCLPEDGYFGFNDIVCDRDGIVRRGVLFMDDAGHSFYSFPLLVAMVYLDPEGVRPASDERGWLRLGEATFRPFEAHDGGYVDADARGYQFLLDFKGGRNAFTSVSLRQVLKGSVPPEVFRDKVVVIGTTAESMKDYFWVPIRRQEETGSVSGAGSEGAAGDGAVEEWETAVRTVKISGIEYHGFAVSQLLRAALAGEMPVRAIPEWQEWLWVLFWGLMGGLSVVRRRSELIFATVTVGLIGFLGGVTLVLFQLGWWLPVAPPALAAACSAAMVTAFLSHQEKLEKDQMMRMFSTHVSKEIAEALWQQREEFMASGRIRSQKVVATVLFSDLKGFTPISERLGPEELMHWLNAYMEAMGQVIMARGGQIDKYIGDAIMAVFGIPVARTEEAAIRQDARNAVAAALAMGREIGKLNARWEAQGLPATQTRIGIYTGPLVAGCLGARDRMQYTVLGDTVNVAARLEGFGKGEEDPELLEQGYRILIGESTWMYLDADIETRKVGEVELKGKSEPLPVYRVVGETG